ncbi:GAF and ANTAR domain-containing protein [Actinosynnema sp. NPDC023658]|uniref:ANTAR domain-containing response regulator n=1 Tax=Actinosynnema sp. NPDC023658 TaxID=3155465 RepID=UPI0033EF33F0
MDGQRGEGTDSGDDHLVRRLDEVTAALERLTELLEDEEDLSVILDRLCRQVIRAIPGADMSSVTLVRDDIPVTGAVTEDQAFEVDLAQYRSGQGPCLQAAATREMQRVAVAEVWERWPAFAEAASGLGVASYLSAPLFIDREYNGSLNLYSRSPHGFRELDAALLELYTTAAEGALRNARRYLNARGQASELRTALTSRSVIDQAKGIVMAVHRIDADQAFRLLVDRSQRENVKLRDLAEQFVKDATAPAEPDGAGA